MTFVIKQGDTSPSIKAVLTDSDGVAINLTGCSVDFVMKDYNNGVVLNEAMTIVTPLQGIVQYDWQIGDTDNTGTYYAEFKVTYTNLSVETFPNNSNVTVVIYPALVP
jgi:hypothetical protein